MLGNGDGWSSRRQAGDLGNAVVRPPVEVHDRDGGGILGSDGPSGTLHGGAQARRPDQVVGDDRDGWRSWRSGSGFHVGSLSSRRRLAGCSIGRAMRLATFDPASPRLGIVDGDRLVPVAAVGPRLPASIAELLVSWPESYAELVSSRESESLGGIGDIAGIPLREAKLLAPVPRPGKILAVGLNYRSHAEEQHREPPDHPVIFAKLPTAVVGPDSEVRWSPGLTQAVDCEVELAVVIGRTCRRVESAEALDFVAGYTCLNDVTARDLQYSDRQFVRGKSLDTFCPLGPWLVTADEIPDPQVLGLSCRVNGEVRQRSSTADMIFGVAELIAFCSQAFTLEPGDVIATGTPAGVGWFREPKLLLHDGDEVEVEIERIGILRNMCVEE